MTHDLTIGAAAVLGTFFGCRMAYGCWPWEWTKTWHTRTVVRNHLGYTDEQWSSVSDLCIESTSFSTPRSCVTLRPACNQASSSGT